LIFLCTISKLLSDILIIRKPVYELHTENYMIVINRLCFIIENILIDKQVSSKKDTNIKSCKNIEYYKMQRK
jgi:hypothetical protein